jgi:deoxyribose-phosphate aldolase
MPDYPPQDVDLAPYIDHSLLEPTATEEILRRYCEEADRYKFASVCIYPYLVKQAAELLHNLRPKVCTVIGFPTGCHTRATKLYEAQEAVDNGAKELDVVINLGWMKAGRGEAIYQEIAAICEATNVPVKAILETSLFTPPEIELAVAACLDAGVAFLKTSTGWRGGATVQDVQLLAKLSKGRVGIKASGGIRTYTQAVELIAAGATRLGTSRGSELLAPPEQ